MGLGTWKHTSSILAGLFIRHQHGSNNYVASYAPIATALMTNKNPAQSGIFFSDNHLSWFFLVLVELILMCDIVLNVSLSFLVLSH
ncbi:hypothetical protein BMR07_01145 [Methylococcaceae bacterium CS1]|nr:hypothetical protein BMR10_11985 [Methylococcaceae bacterium CS4]TXL01345.1 hypothetical protein BMR11_00575 [Methylococcaceae bacterium CS5]TXL03023.1 hypothetical protein BMR09_15730 [Methylococcaceae bacterium CS3]TXL08966.1 hypothetical protein BMR07_01145 [Methylococcaceae bacterium CS1]TXL09621.1 hypothetical protein BMR08_12965 [Methylococcaceae bacterium CS2]